FRRPAVDRTSSLLLVFALPDIRSSNVGKRGSPGPLIDAAPGKCLPSFGIARIAHERSRAGPRRLIVRFGKGALQVERRRRPARRAWKPGRNRTGPWEGGPACLDVSATS